MSDDLVPRTRRTRGSCQGQQVPGWELEGKDSTVPSSPGACPVLRTKETSWNCVQFSSCQAETHSCLDVFRCTGEKVQIEERHHNKQSLQLPFLWDSCNLRVLITSISACVNYNLRLLNSRTCDSNTFRVGFKIIISFLKRRPHWNLCFTIVTVSSTVPWNISSRLRQVFLWQAWTQRPVNPNKTTKLLCQCYKNHSWVFNEAF